MAYYAVIYDLVDDYLARRGEYRDEHLKLARAAHARGELVLGGAFAEPPDQALLIFCAEDRGVPEMFVHEDPYVVHGLVKSWKLRPWMVVIGNK